MVQSCQDLCLHLHLPTLPSLVSPFIVHSHQNFMDYHSLVSDPPLPRLCPFRSSPDKLFIIQVSAQTSFLKVSSSHLLAHFQCLDLLSVLSFFITTKLLLLTSLFTSLLIFIMFLTLDSKETEIQYIYFTTTSLCLEPDLDNISHDVT